MSSRWTPQETEMLEELMMNLPLDMVHQAYNAWASRNGAALRTYAALMIRSQLNGMQMIRGMGEWITTKHIADLLGVSRATPLYWVKRYNFPHHRSPSRTIYFRRADLHKIAKNRPGIFGGIHADNLFLLLEDRELADQIAARYSRRGRDPKPVKAIETG